MQEHYSGSFFTFSSCQGIYKIIGLKGQSNEILDPYLFSSFEPAWAADQQVKIFSILVSFSPRYSYFSESPRGIITQQVYLPWASYPGESSDFTGS